MLQNIISKYSLTFYLTSLISSLILDDLLLEYISAS